VYFLKTSDKLHCNVIHKKCRRSHRLFGISPGEMCISIANVCLLLHLGAIKNLLKIALKGLIVNGLSDISRRREIRVQNGTNTSDYFPTSGCDFCCYSVTDGSFEIWIPYNKLIWGEPIKEVAKSVAKKSDSGESHVTFIAGGPFADGVCFYPPKLKLHDLEFRFCSPHVLEFFTT